MHEFALILHPTRPIDPVDVPRSTTAAGDWAVDQGASSPDPRKGNRGSTGYDTIHRIAGQRPAGARSPVDGQHRRHARG
jgi:hypothetical protein